jgi:cytoskeletal protein RodZ
VEAVSAGSRIVPRLVDALEADRDDLLPVPVYVRGFIRAYCAQVGADPEEALRLYEERVGPPPPLTVPAPRPPTQAFPAGRRWGRVALGAVLVVFLAVGGTFVLGRRQPDAVASRPGSTATASRAPTAPAPPVPTTTASSPGASGPAERVLVMRAVEATWIRIQPDGGEPSEETLAPGLVREWRGTGRFHVTLGNAGAVELELDGRPRPSSASAAGGRDVLVPPGGPAMKFFGPP